MLLWWRLGWRNLWRNPGRSLIQIVVIGGSLALAVFLVNLTEGSYAAMIDEGVRMGSGHLAFYHHAWLTERRAGQVFDPSAALARLAGDPRVLGAFPRLTLFGLGRSAWNSRPVGLLGLDLAAEAPHSPLLSEARLQAGERPRPGARTAYLGAGLAEDLRLRPGRKLVLQFSDRHGEIVSHAIRVGGVFRTRVSQIDRTTVILDRELLAGLFKAPGKIHELAIRLHDRSHLDAVLGDLRTLPGLDPNARLFSWHEAMPAIHDAIRKDRAHGQFIIFILYLIVGIGTANTLLMSVGDRVREFGLMRALGTPGPVVRGLVTAEALAAGLTGIAVGLLAAGLGTWYGAVHGIDFSGLMTGDLEVAGVLVDPVIRPIWAWGTMAVLSLLLLALVLLASLEPARQALKIRPAEAMRRFA